MSGGSYDYFYSKLEDFATSIRLTTPERRAFRELCLKVAKAAHAIEWVDSCDYAKGDETPLIMECVGPSAVLEQAVQEALRVHNELGDAIVAAGQRLAEARKS